MNFFLSPMENTLACIHPIGPTLKKKKSSLFLIVYLVVSIMFGDGSAI
jgi:hypothetical protein